jgi:hypothetical protein
LIINSITVTKPTPEGFYIDQEAVVHSTSQFHPRLDAFNISLFLEDTEPNIIPFFNLTNPATLAGSETPLHIAQQVQILNQSEYNRFSSLIVTSESFRFGIRGKTNLHEGGLPVHSVDYNKAPTLKGLNRLKGTRIATFKVLLTPQDSDGTNFIGTLSIPNPTVFTLDLGNQTFDLTLEGKPLGSTRLNNVFLKPGNNSVPLLSTTNQSMVLEYVQANPNTNIPIIATGNSTVYNGLHIPYYELPFTTTQVLLPLNLSSPNGVNNAPAPS